MHAAGDPIEIGAVVSAYEVGAAAPDSSSSSSREAPFLFSTIKGYAGHSEAGAGTVGVLEAVAIMQQQALAPVLHVRELNPYVAQPLEGKAALINRSAGLAPVSHWQHSEGLVALGVSSFGAQVRAGCATALHCTAPQWIQIIVF
jgi:acyl transferase domain-containing protein